jgi:large subunit ribosomal protein L25
MKQQKLTVRRRNGIGRGHSRRIRAGGEVPAVIYGKHSEPQALAVNERVLGQLLKDIAGSAAVLEIEAEGSEPRLSIIKEVQRNPTNDRILHIDLNEVSADEEMDVTVIVRTKGDSFGVLNEAGVLDISSHELDIRCLPKDLPEFIEVDVTDLHVGQTIHVRELVPIDGVTFIDDGDRPVISCVMGIVEEEVVPEEEIEGEEGEGVEGEEGAEEESSESSEGEAKEAKGKET